MTENLDKALFKLQGVLRGVKKDSANPHFKNRYASLEQVTDTIRPHMQDLGLYFRQYPGRINDNAIQVSTEIVHAESGEKFSFCMEMPLSKRDPQGAGSAMTYAMRYSLMAALGLPPTDDDAETAIDRNNERDAPENPKSSAQLKREGEWERVSKEVAEAMLDVHTFGEFEKLKESYRQEASKNGWNRTFMEQLRDLFLSHEDALKKTIEQENDSFPGDDISNHPLNAG